MSNLEGKRVMREQALSSHGEEVNALSKCASLVLI
jgi:hypothetical protein